MENYSIITEKIIEEIKESGKKPTLLLHACCAPCSSYVLEYLSNYFYITLYYYNPNISPKEEFESRFSELERFVNQKEYSIPVIMGEYEPKLFYEIASGRETENEGGERCFSCYRLRLQKSGEYASLHGFDYFTTTLSISPYKNAEKLNVIGREIEEELGVKYLCSDFKKKNGYKRSIELSNEYGLYRQNYCGCIFSKIQRENARGE